MNILAWNVRGLNRPSMQVEIKNCILKFNLVFLGLIETRVKLKNMEKIKRTFIPNSWSDHSNISFCRSARIWLFWNKDTPVTILDVSEQFILYRILYNSAPLLMTFCYGSNDPAEMEKLWSSLTVISASCNIPWIVLGDFNVIRWVHEKQGGANPDLNSLQSFNSCIDVCGLMDLPMVGLNFTWSNSSFGDKRVEWKLDRVLINNEFLLSCSNLKGTIMQPSISDHSPLLISKDAEQCNFRVPFRFFNAWTKEEGFFETVQDASSVNIVGTPMFIVYQKMQSVKHALISWRKSRPWAAFRIADAKLVLEHVQAQIFNHSGDRSLFKREKKARVDYQETLLAEESMMQQKARERNLNLGDKNTRYFYSIFKANQKRIAFSMLRRREDLLFLLQRRLKKLLHLISSRFSVLLWAITEKSLTFQNSRSPTLSLSRTLNF